MGQRKLTDTQKKAVSDAHCCIGNMCSWEDTSHGRDYWFDVKLSLSAMLAHGTTDGKPYVEPQPEIGEGYRVATDGATDRGRYDREGWVDGEWKRAGVGHTVGGIVYRVPIDRIPTDDDARQRPAVMVRDNGINGWLKANLVCVTKRGRRFIVFDGEEVTPFAECRFPYPGE